MILLWTAGIIAGIYAFLILTYRYWWQKHPVLTVPDKYVPDLKLSVIIVAHNESAVIAKCIESIRNQNYPAELYEVIVINDRSADQTTTVLDRLAWPGLKTLHLHEHPSYIVNTAFKKSGITLGVAHATTDWLVVTDADCVHSPDWLRTIAFAKKQSDAHFMTAPVLLTDDNTWLGKMQQMENIVLMTITAAGISSKLHDMANGANMSFSKSAFQKINGFEGNYQYPSGDDMFLIEKMRSIFPDNVFFIKSITAIATTRAKPTWKSLLGQRLRWAGKNAGLKNPVFNLIWGFIGVYHIALMILCLLPIFSTVSFIPFLILLLTKWIVDFVLIKNGFGFFDKKLSIPGFILLEWMYALYVIVLGANMMMGRKGDWR